MLKLNIKLLIDLPPKLTMAHLSQSVDMDRCPWIDRWTDIQSQRLTEIDLLGHQSGGQYYSLHTPYLQFNDIDYNTVWPTETQCRYKGQRHIHGHVLTIAEVWNFLQIRNKLGHTEFPLIPEMQPCSWSAKCCNNIITWLMTITPTLQQRTSHERVQQILNN